jgi:hypothetical protein
MMSDELKIFAEMLLELKAVKQTLTQIQHQISPSLGQTEGWMRPDEAWFVLKPEGVISQRHLSDLRRAGVFNESKGEIRNVTPHGSRSTWEYYTPNCRKALQRHFRNPKVSYRDLR